MRLKSLMYLFLLLGLVWFAIPSHADETGAYFKFGNIEFTYPLAHTSVISLYDFTDGTGLLGAETRLVSGYNFTFYFGAVTSFKANGMPFVSLGFNFAELISNLPPNFANIGVWFGHDFKVNENRAGIKASVPLW